MRIHIGCGKRYLEGWFHVDVIPSPHIDLVADMTMLHHYFECNSIDEIYICHVLEHFKRTYKTNRYHDIKVFLQRLNRLLKPSGKIRIAVPDFRSIVQAYNEGYDLEQLLGLLYGGHRDEYDVHTYAFDQRTMTKILESAGFENVKPYNWEEFLPDGFDDYSRAYLPHMDKDGILMSLNLIATKKSA